VGEPQGPGPAFGGSAPATANPSRHEGSHYAVIGKTGAKHRLLDTRSGRVSSRSTAAPAWSGIYDGVDDAQK
jgi:hypothetical protein